MSSVTSNLEINFAVLQRGNDVPHNPVAYAYAVVELETATLFTDLSKITDEVSLHLKEAQVSVKSYSSVLSYLERLKFCYFSFSFLFSTCTFADLYDLILYRLASNGCKLWLDPSRVSVAIINTFEAACSEYYKKCKKSKKSGKTEKGPSNSESQHESDGPAALQRTSPIALAKAKKNVAELDGMRQAHLRYIKLSICRMHIVSHRRRAK